MKLLARLFSALTLVALICAIWIALLPQRPTAPDRPAPDPAVLTGPVDRILIEKSARRMVAYRDGAPLKTYRIALGFAPDGDKRQQGDGKTPEGIFRIDRRNEASAYHLSLGIDYPQAKDRARAAAEGIDPGGDIFIHGQPNQLPRGILLPGDWTAGCIAISNAEIAELFAATAIGTEVEIRP
ncbi:L,D-transpeptidase family protein [Paracoccus methylarcula]|uniref:L,D-TPase catalytic domain-containing protein n=1 Tax=Paracoccus methylarcula TaxID=72022 RepID=A0A3R7PRM5_9RHOB|nr:L,D-transpeptidase family protein [Paracoccus methylarcula]RNF36195.1 hypothetical protein A7A09_002075 [Paracoccus methylarcula]